MASFLHSFDPPTNGSAVNKVTYDEELNEVGVKDLSQNASKRESAILLGSKDANGEDVSKRQVLCVRKTRSGGHKTYMATENQLQMVYYFRW
jgi:hypothetical protein